MKNKIVKIVAAIAIALVGVCGLAKPVFADDAICSNKELMGNEAWNKLGCNDGGPQKSGVQNLIVNILKVVIGAAGIVAVIYIVIGGFNYTTSLGDPNKIAKARKTILYAVVGLIVCALAFAIVNFTIGRIEGEDTTESYTENSDKSLKEGVKERDASGNLFKGN